MKFFHTSTLIRRKTNRIFSLKDSQDVWIHNEDEIAAHIGYDFQELFTSSTVSAPRGTWDIPSWPSHMSLEKRDQVTREIFVQKVKDSLSSLELFKVPGPNGLHAGFFQA